MTRPSTPTPSAPPSTTTTTTTTIPTTTPTTTTHPHPHPHAPPFLPSSPISKRPKMSTPTPPPPPPPLLIKKLSSKATTPTRGSALAAGYDLYAARTTTIPARGKTLVDTDIAIAVPEGTYGRIAPRSGLAAKHFIDTGAGVIDADYRGQVKVLLFNHGEGEYEVVEGERVAQLVLERIYTPEVLVVDDLEESVRGAGGFGSTG